MRLIRLTGFTLVEIMIVIAILGIFLLSIAQMMWGAQLDQEKALRFSHLVYDHIRDARQDMIIGRGTRIEEWWQEKYIPSEARIVNFLNTGAIRIQYIPIVEWPSPSPGGERDLQLYAIPFLGEPEYFIRRYEVSTAPLAPSGNIAEWWDWVSVDGMKLTFYGAGKIPHIEVPPSIVAIQGNIRSYRITLGYKDFVRYIVGDVLSGFAEIHNSVSVSP